MRTWVIVHFPNCFIIINRHQSSSIVIIDHH